MIEIIGQIIVTMGLAAFAYFGKDKPMYFIAGIGFMLFGWDFTQYSVDFSILLVVAGLLMCVRAFTKKGIT